MLMDPHGQQEWRLCLSCFKLCFIQSIVLRSAKRIFILQVSAVYMVKRRLAFQASLVAFETFEESNAIDVLAGPPEEVGPPVYVGQAPRLLKRGLDNHAQRYRIILI